MNFLFKVDTKQMKYGIKNWGKAYEAKKWLKIIDKLLGIKRFNDSSQMGIAF